MNNDSNPLDYLIECCEKAVNTGYWTLTKFNILNAKDELFRLKQAKRDMSIEAFKANQFACEEMNRNLEFKQVVWATINGRGDMFNLSLIYNQFSDPESTIPLYCNEKEFKEKYGKLSKQMV